MHFGHVYILFTSLLCLVLISSSLSGQQMEIKSKYEIRHNDQVLDYREMGDKFAFSAEASNWHRKSLKSFKTAKTMGWVTLGALGAGAILLNVDDGGRNCSAICVTPAKLTGLGLLIIVMPITGVTSLITLKSGINRQKKAVKAYNEHDLGYQREKTVDKIVFGVTQNGLGFVFQF